MSRRGFVLMAGILALALLVAAGSIPTAIRNVRAADIKAAPGVPDTPDARAIQATIARAYRLTERAASTFDVSEFPSVFINDPRGGKLRPDYQSIVEDYLGIVEDEAGYLDYNIAYYMMWKNGAQRLQGLQAKMAREGRRPTRAEMQSLLDRSGRPAAHALPEGLFPPAQLVFESISVNGDTAVAVFNDGPRDNRTILVSVGGQWYIAGNTILTMSP